MELTTFQATHIMIITQPNIASRRQKPLKQKVSMVLKDVLASTNAKVKQKKRRATCNG